VHDPVQMSDVRRRIEVRGKVQGVFFRASVADRARAAGVRGWARNRDDGSVEVVLEGPADAVESVVQFTRTGPERARVEDVTIHEEPAEGLEGFESG
jgi:acylphosphatase